MVLMRFGLKMTLKVLIVSIMFIAQHASSVHKEQH